MIRENNQAGGFTHTWSYDATGNIEARYEYPYTTGELGEYTDRIIYTYDEDWGDLLLAYGDYETGRIYSDLIGNPLYDGTWNYTWEHGRELMGMYNDTASWTFTYDANGMRTQRSNGSTTYQYLYNGSNLVQMTVGNDTMYFTYGVSGLPVAVTIGETSYYYVTNIQGDVIAILDASENPVVTYSYDAWGNILTTGGSMAATLGTLNPFRYRCYIYDQETHLYYLQSRYYNPEWGRFINADDIDYLGVDDSLLSYNLFTYCMNNPVNCFDFNGNRPMPNWLKVTVGAAAITGLAIATICTGGAAAVICGAALSGAIAGGASGAVMGAIGGGVSGGWQGALDGACSGFMSGTLIGGVTGAASAGLNIATGATTVIGNAHGSALHKLAINTEAGKMAASGQYSQIGINKSLRKMGLQGGLTRPDIIGIAKNRANKLVEVVSPRQSTNYIVNKMSNMLSNNPGAVGKIVTWVRNLLK